MLSHKFPVICTSNGPALDGDFATYLHTKLIPKLKELLSNYGDFPTVIWFHTPTRHITPALAGELVTLLNQHPNLIWHDRLGGGYAADTQTPEQFISPQGYPGRDWEACMTINDTWGYKADDTHFKSTETLLRNRHGTGVRRPRQTRSTSSCSPGRKARSRLRRHRALSQAPTC